LKSSVAQKQQKIYDGEAVGYVPVYQDAKAFKLFLTSQVERARQLGQFGTSLKAVRNARELARLDLRPGQRVLDAGCGGGILINQLVALYKVKGAGVDLSTLALSRAKACGAKGITYKQGLLEKLPFPKNSFDAVVSFDVLEHVEGKEQAIVEIMRVLKPGGKALLYVISSRGFLTWHWWLRVLTFGRWGVDNGAGHSKELFASPYTTKKQFEARGARVARLRYLHSFFTLMVDEVIFKLQEKRGPQVRAVTGRGGHQLAMKQSKAYRMLQVLEAGLEFLEIPWKLLGLSNGFFIQVEKSK
jgi:ubiquinone/menaquinone biosynthesis C-methylase UbiE